MLIIIVSSDLSKLDQQIHALNWQLSHDTNRKDIIVDKQALKELMEHREQLKVGD